MIASLAAAAGTALWLGVLTSLSPCPLATNIAALSYIGKGAAHPRRMVLSALLYTAGRVLSYFAIAFAVVQSLVAIPTVAMFLQRDINRWLGPILIATGILLIDVIPWPWLGGTSSWATALHQRVAHWGHLGALILGIGFALAFCPVSAALFFGSLIPLAAAHQSSALLPGAYGLGTALPVMLFALFLAFATQRVGRVFSALQRVEPWLRRGTALVFIAVGIYYCITYLS